MYETMIACPNRIQLDSTSQYLELAVLGMKSLRAQVDLDGGSWNGAVVGVFGSVDPYGTNYIELDVAYRLSAPGMTTKIDVAGLASVRLQVITASGTSGTLATFRMGASEA